MKASPAFSLRDNVSSVTCFYFTAPIFMTTPTLAVNVIACVLNVFFAMCSSIGNFLIVVALWKTLLHTPENILLGWFAFCDFLLGFIAGPAFVAFKAAEITKNFTIYCGARFAYEFSSQTALNASFAILTFMSIDRYLALHFHLRYKGVVTKRRLTTAVFIALVLSVSMTISRYWVDYRTFLFITKSSNFVYLCIILVVYFKILILVRRHQIHMTQHRAFPYHSSNPERNMFVDFARYKKYTCTVAFIIFLIVACYLPATVVSFCKEYVCTERLEHAKITYTLMVTFIFLTTSLHPLVFIWRSREVSEAIKKLW